MATYPTFPQVIGSSLDLVDDLQVDEAVDGSARARAFFPAAKHAMHLAHVLDDTDLATLITFYNDHRADPSVSVQWKPDCNGTTYTCVFVAAPKIRYDNPFHQVEVDFREV